MFISPHSHQGFDRQRSGYCLILVCAWLAVSVPIASRAQDSGSIETPPKPARTFTGGVKGTAIPAVEGLGRIGAACDAVADTTDRIMKEASRKDTIVVRGPNYIGNGIVVPAVGGVGGVMQFGDMPIHKDKLARWMSETAVNLEALKSYVDGLIVPPTIDSAKAGEAYTKMGTALQSADLHMDILQHLAVERRLNNERIHSEALAIHNAAAQILRERSTLTALFNALNDGSAPAPSNGAGAPDSAEVKGLPTDASDPPRH